MGDSHIRSNFIEETSGLKVKFTNASFTNLTVDTMTVVATHVSTLTSNSFTATTGVIKTLTSVTKASLTNVTATSMVVKNASFTTAYIATGKTAALTATTGVFKTSLKTLALTATSIAVSATPGFNVNLVASFTSLTGGTAARMLRVTSLGATPMYVKLYTR